MVGLPALRKAAHQQRQPLLPPHPADNISSFKHPTPARTNCRLIGFIEAMLSTSWELPLLLLKISEFINRAEKNCCHRILFLNSHLSVLFSNTPTQNLNIKNVYSKVEKVNTKGQGSPWAQKLGISAGPNDMSFLDFAPQRKRVLKEPFSNGNKDTNVWRHLHWTKISTWHH